MRALSIAVAVACTLGCSDDDVPPATPCVGAACGVGGIGAGGGGGAGGGEPTIQCPESGVYHGPWSLHIDETSALVRWDACKESDAGLTFTPEDGGAPVTVTGTQTAAEVTTKFDTIASVPPDLPGTCYHYELAADPKLGGRVCTARPSGDPLTFLAIGDTNPIL